VHEGGDVQRAAVRPSPRTVAAGRHFRRFISESAKFDGIGGRAGGSFHPGGLAVGGTSDFVTMRKISRTAWPRQFTG